MIVDLSVEIEPRVELQIQWPGMLPGDLVQPATPAAALAVVPFIRGEQGPPGTAASSFRFDQTIAAQVWTVPHNLGKRPSVTVVDHLGRQVFADVDFIDDNIVRVTHAMALTGAVYCN